MQMKYFFKDDKNLKECYTANDKVHSLKKREIAKTNDTLVDPVYLDLLFHDFTQSDT